MRLLCSESLHNRLRGDSVVSCDRILEMDSIQLRWISLSQPRIIASRMGLQYARNAERLNRDLLKVFQRLLSQHRASFSEWHLHHAVQPLALPLAATATVVVRGLTTSLVDVFLSLARIQKFWTTRRCTQENLPREI